MSANYITINSTFEPDDYKTMLEEAKDMTAQQQALEDKMTEQRTGMAALKQTANTPYARALLDQFETHLNNASDSLSRNGLSMQTRATAKDLIPLFSQTVLPASTAVAAKDAMIKAQENDIKEGKDIGIYLQRALSLWYQNPRLSMSKIMELSIKEYQGK